MPIVEKIEVGDRGLVALWHCDESEDWLVREAKLPPYDQKILEKLNTDRRRREWLTVRVVVRQLLGCSVGYEPSGRPVALGYEGHISVSHAAGYVAFMVSDRRCGVDIEASDRDFSRAAPKFVGPREAELTDDLSIIWCAKEAIFKITGRVNLLDIHIDKIESKTSKIISNNLIINYINMPDIPLTLVYGQEK